MSGSTALGTGVRYLVSDRAKALIQLAEQGLECLSMPDFFHLVHDMVKSYSLAIGAACAAGAPGTDESRGRARKPPGTLTSGCRLPRGQASGGGDASGGAALGSGAQHVSAAPRDPLAHAASFPLARLQLPRPPPR